MCILDLISNFVILVNQATSSPDWLRAQVPVDEKARAPLSNGNDANGHKAEPKIRVRVLFSCSGPTLSGLSVTPMKEDSKDFIVGEHTFKTGQFLCS